jgi:colicin import membrane protein
MPPTPMQRAEQARKNAEARKKVGNEYKATRAEKYSEQYVKPIPKKKTASSSPLFEKMRKKVMENERLRRELNEEMMRKANQRRRNENTKKEAEHKRIENERRRIENERRRVEQVRITNENKQIKNIYTKV